YSQEARFAMLGSFNMVVARAEVDFKAPINEGNIFVDMSLWVESIGTSSFTMVYEISKDGTLVARVKSVQVTVTEDTKSSRPLTDDQREILKTFLETE
ncbi:MAG: thioesterase, partial [Actinobacteria bacterium]|nr:thioesterase [Actinomycetota bacterium]